jgi:hypothetical protein
MSAGTPAMLTEVCHDFPQSLQANAGIVPLLGHNQFLQNYIQLIGHSMLYSFDTEKASLTNPLEI